MFTPINFRARESYFNHQVNTHIALIYRKAHSHKVISSEDLMQLLKSLEAFF